ncbi:hypothetical protein [Arthrobacter cheniae]|uniref:hypothetical protein n=1 Tax=Arthrobacter cheniae TaxID=1258888 RepID=UPI0011C43CE7|nr:hypothetical protein [Arthrobacter cheniae]
MNSLNTDTAVLVGTTTKDTEETVGALVLPVDDRTGDGYDWLDNLTGSPWKVMGAWGIDGWDAESWPYVFFATAIHRNEIGTLYGYGTYVEGDTYAHWYRAEDACHRAITAEVFWYWKHGQADGPSNLPASAEELTEQYTKPYGCIHR